MLLDVVEFFECGVDADIAYFLNPAFRNQVATTVALYEQRCCNLVSLQALVRHELSHDTLDSEDGPLAIGEDLTEVATRAQASISSSNGQRS